MTKISIALIIGALTLTAEVGVAGDLEAQLKGMKKCESKSNRARKLAWDLKKKREKKCSAMDIGSADFDERERKKGAQKECYEKLASSFEDSIFQIDETTEECYDAARSL